MDIENRNKVRQHTTVNNDMPAPSKDITKIYVTILLTRVQCGF